MIEYIFLALGILSIIVVITYPLTDNMMVDHPWWLIAMDTGLIVIVCFCAFVFFGLYATLRSIR